MTNSTKGMSQNLVLLSPMKNPLISRSAALSTAFLIAVCGLTATTNEPVVPSETSKHGKPKLVLGMTDAQVRQIVGAPLAIEPVDLSDSTKAERWRYRRVVRTESSYDSPDIEQRFAFVGPGRGDSNNIDIIGVPDVRVKRTDVVQMSELIMVEGKLVMARQWTEREVKFDN